MIEGPVYLAGPMAGIAGFNYPAFNDAADKLRAQGVEVFNPAELAKDLDVLSPNYHVTPAQRAAYMERDFGYILQAKAIVLLFDYMGSTGANLELLVAQATGKEVWLATRGNSHFLRTTRVRPDLFKVAKHIEDVVNDG